MILETQRRFRREKHNVFTKEINDIPLISNDDKIMRLIDSIETYPYGTSKYLVSEKEEFKYNDIMQYTTKMINFNYSTKENIKEHNPN